MAITGAYLDQLAAVPLFAGVPKKDLRAILRAADEITVPAGRELVREGEIGHEFYLIVDGACTVRRGNRRVARLGPGQWFGELALLARAPRNATVTTDAETTLLILGQRQFLALLDDIPGLAARMLRTLAARIHESDQRNYAN